MINTELKKINVMNDAVAKAFLRSREARMIVASFLSEVTGIDKKILIDVYKRQEWYFITFYLFISS